MTRYVISDHHFGHNNIIEYCDRPFTSVGEMNEVMLNRHYETIDPADTVIHLGDVAMDMTDGGEAIEWFSDLNGDLLIKGNHDIGINPEDAPFPIVESCIIEHHDRMFYCTHRPEDVPHNWDEWVIHGHHHNNDLEEYPFIHYDLQQVNVGAELLEYRPIDLDTVSQILDLCSVGDRIRDASVARERFESCDVSG